MKPLTPRQREVYATICEGYDRGLTPTLRELCAATKIRSTNGVTDHLLALLRKGYVWRPPEGRSGAYAPVIPAPDSAPLSESEWGLMLRLAALPADRAREVIAAAREARRAA